MGLRPYGTDAFLRFQLRNKLRNLQQDDKDILWEGLESLNRRELQLACQERGMRAVGLSADEYKQQMAQWLDLSINKHIPPSLLIMSRAFTFNQFSAHRAVPAVAPVDCPVPVAIEITVPSVMAADILESRADDRSAHRADADIEKVEDVDPNVAIIADTISSMDYEVGLEVVLEGAAVTDQEEALLVREMKLESIEIQNEMIDDEREELQKAKDKDVESEETSDDLQPMAALQELTFESPVQVKTRFLVSVCECALITAINVCFTQ